MSNTDYSVFALKITGIALDKLDFDIVVFSGYVFSGEEASYTSGGKSYSAPPLQFHIKPWLWERKTKAQATKKCS